MFVFQTPETLITATNSVVALIGGATACNVFWQVGSSATLGVGTTFVGTLAALSSITASTGVSVDGRLLARTAAVTLDTNLVTRPACSATPPSPTATPSATPSPSATAAPTATASPTASPTASATATATPTPTPTATPAASPTGDPAPSVRPSRSASPAAAPVLGGGTPGGAGGAPAPSVVPVRSAGRVTPTSAVLPATGAPVAQLALLAPFLLLVGAAALALGRTRA